MKVGWVQLCWTKEMTPYAKSTYSNRRRKPKMLNKELNIANSIIHVFFFLWAPL